MEQEYASAVADGRLQGAVLCARDATGAFRYDKAWGTRTTLSGETQPLQTTDVLWMASATKLLATVAAMQCVEEGLVALDADVSAHLPELGAKEVLTGWNDDGNPQLEAARHAITLRQLLTHTSGWSYDSGIEEITRWQEWAGYHAGADTATVQGRFTWPLMSQPGEGWAYGPSADWAGKLVERVTGRGLLQHLGERVFGPLGVDDYATFPVPDRLRARSADVHPGDPDGRGLLSAGGYDIHKESAGECFGGHGVYVPAPGFCAVLASLLANDGKLLKPATVDLMFAPQLAAGNRFHFDDLMGGEMNMFFAQGTDPETKRDFGLGGMLVMEDLPGWWRQGTMTWSGGLNTAWFIDRKAGLCGIGSPQIVAPVTHEENARLKNVYRKGIYEVYQEWKKSSGAA